MSLIGGTLLGYVKVAGKPIFLNASGGAQYFIIVVYSQACVESTSLLDRT